MLRQVGEGRRGPASGSHGRGELAPVDPVPAAHRLDHPGEIQSSKQASLPAQVAMGLIAEGWRRRSRNRSLPRSHPCRASAHGGQAG